MNKKPKPEKRSRTYRLSVDLIEALEQLAEHTRRSATAELEIALERHLVAEGFATAKVKPAKPPKS